MIGSWGKLVFTVSAQRVKTFHDMKRSESARWSKHDVHLKKTKSEFIGIDQGSITFTMQFSSSLNLNPMEELDALIRASRTGEAHQLIIGNKRFGLGKYYIKSISGDLKHWTHSGHLLSTSVNVTMEEYI